MVCMCKSLLLISCMFQFQLKGQIILAPLFIVVTLSLQYTACSCSCCIYQPAGYKLLRFLGIIFYAGPYKNRYLHTEYERLIRIITYRKPTVGGGEGVCLYLNFIG